MKEATRRRASSRGLRVVHDSAATSPFPPLAAMPCERPGCGNVGATVVCMQYGEVDAETRYAAFCCCGCAKAAGAWDYLKSETRRRKAT